MELIRLDYCIFVTMLATLCLLLLLILTFSWWVFPILKHKKLKSCGLGGGPTPRFPLGNIDEMKIKDNVAYSYLSHDIHANVLPYFSSWQKLHGKVFIYWLGTEPFLYIAGAEFLKKMSTDVMAKRWGKPNVFRNDRDPMFGNGLVMVEGNDWVRHRNIVAPSFNPLNLKAMARTMIVSTNQMIDRWTSQIKLGKHEIDIEKEIIATAGEIIAKTSFGMEGENAREVLHKLRALQMTLFKTNRHVGVPFGKYFNVKKNLVAKKLGKEIDKILLSIVEARKKSLKNNSKQDLLSFLVKENSDVSQSAKTLTTREVVDECKTFFFGGHETTALAITWTLLLLATHEDWQNQLREEIKEVVGNNEFDITMLAGLKKMKWVMNEVLRLYPPSPNVQRQTREDIKVDNVTVPNGTNMWIDVVAMHHDPELWGDDVNEFKPERFVDDVNGGCKHKMGYLPFGFGGRMCVGRNLTFMEYKIVLTMLLSNFTFKVSPGYHHSPAIMLSLRPAHGLPLIVQPLN
ncbi:cytochrome P450 family 72 protein [Medicago truncatula]|uniref:Cytochrome P450 family 72 protein n=2 Tax=Medicago truncatula TaxID=3880 RepID=G7KIF9_MEDTR|nr:cytochrome P450 family 72 protein [Medicago truncatula]